jgi:hypothetical protein
MSPGGGAALIAGAAVIAVLYWRRSKGEPMETRHCSSGGEAGNASTPALPQPCAAVPPACRGNDATTERQKAATSAPPPLGAILALVKETGASRKACKTALIENDNNYDEAKASLLPAEEEPAEAPLAEPSPHAAIPDIFEPCRQFTGGRPGWVFKRGPLGNGYYRDGVDDPAGIAQRERGGEGSITYVQRC